MSTKQNSPQEQSPRRAKLFGKSFEPQPIFLGNGQTVYQPQSTALLILVMVLLAARWELRNTGLNQLTLQKISDCLILLAALFDWIIKPRFTRLGTEKTAAELQSLTPFLLMLFILALQLVLRMLGKGVPFEQGWVDVLVVCFALFNRLFPPKYIRLQDQNSVYQPQGSTPFILALLFFVIVLALNMTGFSLKIIFNRFNELLVLFNKIVQPKWSFFPKVVKPLFDTIKMSVLGTVIGCALALPVSILSASNINNQSWLVAIFRFILGLIRTLPTLILAQVCALIFGLGTFAGTVAIVIFTFGVVSKMLFESIETIDMGPFEAMESLGANKFQAFWSACMPQILPVYLSHSLYCFEMNVRASAILGYVGAGGLGILINERVGWRDYNSLGMVLLALFVTVTFIEFFSAFLRKKLS